MSNVNFTNHNSNSYQYSNHSEKPLSNLKIGNSDSVKSIQDSGKKFSEVKESSLTALDEVQKTLDDMISEINKALSQRDISAQISMDKKIDRYIIRVTDKSTGELLREVPSEAIQRFARNIEQLKGVLFEAVL